MKSNHSFLCVLMGKTFIITPGEHKSIGLEVSLKALYALSKDVQDSYILFGKKSVLEEHLHILDLELKFKFISKLQADLSSGLYFIDSSDEPVDWFKKASDFCSKNSMNTALITGPLVKKSFSNPKILGHTEYLRSQFSSDEIFMTFFGEHYNVLLLNDHLPLNNVSSDVTYKKISDALSILNAFFNPKKIALLGLNPHSGENGLIGTEEDSIHKKICKVNENLDGPLSADGFFSLDSYKAYDFLIANYHDQGLIPFKLINGFNGSQASLGLRFIRTSVDHGTSFDLYLKNKANPSSMLHALKLSKRLLDLKNTMEKNDV